ncbi:hypothetical protein ACLB2K_066489 [Fragaria x ananassa]
MSGLDVKIDKFTGRNSFSLWQIKMRALLKQQGMWAPLVKKSGDPKIAEMASLEEKAHSTILLCLAVDIITEVAEEETTAGLWLKLESLYMTKSLTNKLLLKRRLFSLRMKGRSGQKRWYIWHYGGASDTSGINMVYLVHLALLWCIWYIWHYCGASGTSGITVVHLVHLTFLWCICHPGELAIREYQLFGDLAARSASYGPGAMRTSLGVRGQRPRGPSNPVMMGYGFLLGLVYPVILGYGFLLGLVYRV